ncbi:MAG: hypothetical protein GY810_24190 [Aureispira sp.]|nr:hypothetical protein [Aureispira sp.]
MKNVSKILALFFLLGLSNTFAQAQREVIVHCDDHHHHIVYCEDHKIFKNGFFFDAVAQGGVYRTDDLFIDFYDSYAVAGASLRFGNKWYFGKTDRYRPGLTATWAKAGANYILEDWGYAYPIYNFSLVNLGLTNTFRFDDRSGLEINLNGGFNLIADTDYGELYPGFVVNANIKYRFRKIAVGIDASYTYGNSLQDRDMIADMTLIGLTVGLKF